MPGYLLDTNHLSAAVDRVSRVRERLLQAHRHGTRLGTCVPVLCELETGLHHARHRDHNRAILAQLLKRIKIWPLKRELSLLYAAVFHELRSMGRALSTVDIILAALARQMKLTLLTCDRDFEALPDLRIENWLN